MGVTTRSARCPPTPARIARPAPRPRRSLGHARSRAPPTRASAGREAASRRASRSGRRPSRRQRPVKVALPGPCSRNDRTPMRGVVGAEHLDEQLLLEVEAVGQASVEAARRWPAWPGAWATTGAPARARRPGRGPVEQLVGRHDLGRPGRWAAPRRRSTWRPVRIRSLARAGPDQAGQALGAAAAGDDAEQDLGLAEPGVVARRCAGRRPAPARSRRRGRSRRPRRSTMRGMAATRVERLEERRADRRGPRRAAELGDVGAGGEDAVAAGDHHRAGRVGGRGPRPTARSWPSSSRDSALTLPLSRRRTATPSSRRSRCTSGSVMGRTLPAGPAPVRARPGRRPAGPRRCRTPAGGGLRDGAQALGARPLVALLVAVAPATALGHVVHRLHDEEEDDERDQTKLISVLMTSP